MPSVPMPTTDQDLKPQVFHFKKTETGGGKTLTLGSKTANRVVQSGGQVVVEKKDHYKSNQQKSDLGPKAKIIDEDFETMKVNTVGLGMGKIIQKARQQKEWTQSDLAKLINEKTSVVTDYENGKAVPVDSQITKMEKHLGVFLRGVRAGETNETKAQKAAAAKAAILSAAKK